MYDFRWYVEYDVFLDMECLKLCMGKKYNSGTHPDRQSLIELLDRRFDTLNWESAREDVSELVSNDSVIEPWEPEKYK